VKHTYTLELIVAMNFSNELYGRKFSFIDTIRRIQHDLNLCYYTVGYVLGQ